MTPEELETETETAVNELIARYLDGTAATVYTKVVVGLAYRAGLAAGQRNLAESESQKAHLIAAMRDCWVVAERARSEAAELRAQKPGWSDEHLTEWTPSF